LETAAGVNAVVDPGSGTMLRAREEKVNLQRAQLLLITHDHPDDCIDAEAVIEAMTEGATKKKGTLICSDSIIHGHPGTELLTRISPYHQKALAMISTAKAGDKFEIKGKNGVLKVTATPTKHSDPTTIGFLIEDSDGTKVGITGDCGYFKGMGEHFRGVDMLVTNCMFPRTPESLTLEDHIKVHMNSYDAIRLLKEARPRQAIIWKIGLKMLRAGPEKEAAWLTKETGVKTVASRDGMVVEISRGKQAKLF